jgi:hypothetical protein
LAAVTDGYLRFTTSKTGCVVITFSGLVTADGEDEELRVRTWLDDNYLCVPASPRDIFFRAANTFGIRISSSLTHICKGVPPGQHTLQARYRAKEGIYVEIFGHTLTVTHN